ncbi:coiled-coil domain-containing protein 190 isoform X2 [Rhinolophus ferrumequinum]|uniref:coiled-coil domain-containing protein 190 isoform X2 n=1 Tax=Rhinolophus ferrumequinum TaxID=59479 RepID=UPI00140FAD27|nr:coiled-coil domain-containing protein 190 isoform X2 [Rhinolophus ferrumequinum]
MGSRTVRAQLYRRWDAEQKAAKQAEARLSQCLQRLEETRRRHLALLAREQRQLQTQLQRLQEDLVRKKRSSYFGNGIQKRPEGTAVSPPRGEWTHGARRAGQLRGPATNMVQETHKTKSQRPSRHTGPRDPTISKEQSPSQNHRTSRFREDEPPAREKESTRPAKGVTPAGASLLCQGQDIPAGTADPGPGASRAGDSGAAHSDEARSGDASLQPDHSAGDQISPSPLGRAGTLKGASSTATYLELFAKARHAHYLRHRVPPKSERLLSIGEIFGHRGPVPQSREGGE